MKTLVAYYSLTGNTKFVAEQIAGQLEADLCEVSAKTYKKKGKLLYLKGGSASMREKLTEIESSKSIDAYDLVVVGSPVWAGKIAPPIRTFLVKNDFADKQVALFVTLDGDNAEKTFENIKKTVNYTSNVKGLAVTKALKNQEETQQQVIEWCSQLKND
ncbi:MAG: NAD(P)H-dependent oxidoreductase [Candidatus Bathyarchaeota archaeon]|nr:NAD(P)H-dependent oxidoreductase [Candidatus Bathyarchaeum sp.]